MISSSKLDRFQYCWPLRVIIQLTTYMGGIISGTYLTLWYEWFNFSFVRAFAMQYIFINGSKQFELRSISFLSQLQRGRKLAELIDTAFLTLNLITGLVRTTVMTMEGQNTLLNNNGCLEMNGITLSQYWVIGGGALSLSASKMYALELRTVSALELLITISRNDRCVHNTRVSENNYFLCNHSTHKFKSR